MLNRGKVKVIFCKVSKRIIDIEAERHSCVTFGDFSIKFTVAITSKPIHSRSFFPEHNQFLDQGFDGQYILTVCNVM